MVGRLDDWLRAQAERDGIIVDPGILDWAGVAAMKKAYRIFRERGYRARLLSAAFRNHYHWSEFIGGELSLTIPYAWQVRFHASSVEVRPRIDDPVDPAILDGSVGGLSRLRSGLRRGRPGDRRVRPVPPTVRTLRAFTKSYYDMLSLVTDFLLPNPDTAVS